MEKIKLNIFDKTLKNIRFIESLELNEFIIENNIIDILKTKQKNRSNEYLKAIIDPDYLDYSKDKIKYVSFQDEKNSKFYIIFLDSKLMYNYTKNLDILRNNLLYDDKFIPVTYISEKSTTYSKTNKITYNYNIELNSNSSKNTDIQIESFFPDTIIQNISENICKNYNKKIPEILIKQLEKDSENIKDTFERRINYIIDNPQEIKDTHKNQLQGKLKELLDSYQITKEELEKNNQKRQLKETRELDIKYLIANFKEHDLSKDDILFLLDLLINTDNKKENIINQLELCYNILLFNLLIEKKEYDKIKELIYYTLNINDFSNKKIAFFFLIKLFDDKNIIKNLYFNLSNKNINELVKYNIEYDSFKSLENSIDNILKVFAPFCIPFKKVKYLLEDYINSMNNKSEKVSDYLEGFNLEEEIKNIILRENENIVPLKNLYYILLNSNVTFIEFDLICLVKDNETLKFNKTLFDRVSRIYNCNFLDKIDDIPGLSLIFFEIKTTQHSNQTVAKHLIQKVDFLYPLFKQCLLKYHNIDIEKCKLYFIHIFDYKFNSNSFVSTKISDLKLKLKYLNKSQNNQSKLIFSHVETNVGQYNIRMLTKDINNLKEDISNLKNQLKRQEGNHQTEILNLTDKINNQQQEISQLQEQIKELMNLKNLSEKPENLGGK